MNPLDLRAHKNALEVVGATTEGESQSRWSGSRNEVPTPSKEQNMAILTATTDKALVPTLVAPTSSGTGVPTKPTGILAPAWATEVGEWEFEAMDGVWMRRLSSTIAVPDADGQGIEMMSYQSVDERGVVTSMPIVVPVDIQSDNVLNVRQLAQWFTAAAAVLDEDRA